MAKSIITALVKELKKDEGYYISWKANIAMAIYDTYYKNKKKYKNRADIHGICNEGADNFLQLLIK